MKSDKRSPYTHGMEIEQFPNELPQEVRDYVMNNHVGTLTDWHNDASGPRETSIGPYKNTKTILNRFYKETRDEGHTWNWHASANGAGAGSHVHLCVAEDVFDDPVTAWTISYNTLIELFPFAAPFFCHNWEDGFRDGTEYGHDRLNIERWAEGTLTRFGTHTVEERVRNPTRYGRPFDSVTFNPARGQKPLTLELRANDAHPAMALNGLLLLRRLTGRAVEAGWSPKLVNHRDTLSACYEKIYSRAIEVGLLTAMKEPIDGGIRFESGRGIPGVDCLEFDTMWDVLCAMLTTYPQNAGTWRARGVDLVKSGRDDFGPHRNPEAIWWMDAPRGEFAWDHGPEQVE